MKVDNRISLQKLEIFCRVVELGGVGKAAEDLFLSQPVVSAHLSSLRHRFGSDLFARDGRGIQLTEAGQAVYAWAVDVLRGRVELAKGLEGLTSGMAGSATIGASMSAGDTLLPAPLVQFRLDHPHASLSLRISSAETALDLIRSGWLDFAYVATQLVLDQRIFDAQLVGRPRFALAASSRNTTIPARVTIADLAHIPFVTPPGGMAITRSQDLALARIGLMRRRVSMEMGSAESIKFAVVNDLGICMLWETSMEREFAEGALRPIAIEGHELHDELYFVKRRGKYLTPMQASLQRFLSDMIGRRLSPDEGSKVDDS